MTDPGGTTPPAGGAPPPAPPPGPPAAPPASPATAAAVGDYAEWWQRVVARIIDGVIVGVANTILSLPFGSMFAATAPTLNPTTGQLEGGGGFFATWFVANIILFVLDFAYFTIFHGMPNGQTPGKMVMKIAVRTDEGRGPLGYGKAALRTIVEIVLVWLCVIPGLVDVLFPLWDPKKQTLHDKAANTVVVRVG